MDQFKLAAGILAPAPLAGGDVVVEVADRRTEIPQRLVRQPPAERRFRPAGTQFQGGVEIAQRTARLSQFAPQQLAALKVSEVQGRINRQRPPVGPPRAVRWVPKRAGRR